MDPLNEKILQGLEENPEAVIYLESLSATFKIVRNQETSLNFKP